MSEHVPNPSCCSDPRYLCEDCANLVLATSEEDHDMAPEPMVFGTPEPTDNEDFDPVADAFEHYG
jgi:hypothetical protein